MEGKRGFSYLPQGTYMNTRQTSRKLLINKIITLYIRYDLCCNNRCLPLLVISYQIKLECKLFKGLYEGKTPDIGCRIYNLLTLSGIATQLWQTSQLPSKPSQSEYQFSQTSQPSSTISVSHLQDSYEYKTKEVHCLNLTKAKNSLMVLNTYHAQQSEFCMSTCP